MSVYFQHFSALFDINEMGVIEQNVIPESNSRRMSTGQVFESISFGRARQSVQRPGSSCSINSNSSEGTVIPPIHNKNYQESRYKTELCRHWQENGNCPHGLQCLFAHGLSELKPFRGRHRKYKTQLCKAFHADGFCSFGPRCSYIHSGIDIIPGAIKPFPCEPPQFQEKLSSHSKDTIQGFSTNQLQQSLNLLSMGSPTRPKINSSPAKSTNGVRLSVFSKICHN